MGAANVSVRIKEKPPSILDGSWKVPQAKEVG